MQHLTEQLCRESVGILENVYQDNPEEPDILLSKAIDYCYDYFVQAAEERGGTAKNVYFDGKRNIRNRIKELLRENKILKFKIRDDLLLAKYFSIPQK